VLGFKWPAADHIPALKFEPLPFLKSFGHVKVFVIVWEKQVGLAVSQSSVMKCLKVFMIDTVIC
jgi:hypothetical protein